MQCKNFSEFLSVYKSMVYWTEIWRYYHHFLIRIINETITQMFCFRINHQRCSVRNKNFAKFAGKHQCQSLFFSKVAGLRCATLLKKRLWHRCFPVNFVKLLRTPFFTEHLWWLLLNVKEWIGELVTRKERTITMSTA